MANLKNKYRIRAEKCKDRTMLAVSIVLICNNN